MTEENKEYSVEETLEAIEQLLEKMEDKTCPLEESFRLYKEGIALVAGCRKKLDAVEQQLTVLKEGADHGI